MVEILAQATPSAPDVMQIVQSVHQFYNDAWTSLLWAVGVGAAALIGLVGIIMPWWTERSRRESFRMDKEALLKQIELVRNDMTRQIESETRLYKDSLRDALRQVAASQEAAKKQLEAHSGDMWGAHARQMRFMGMHGTSSIYSSLAIESYINSGDAESHEKVGIELDQLSLDCASIDRRPYSESLKGIADMASKVLRRAEAVGLGERYSKPIGIIKAFLADVQNNQQSTGQSSVPVGQGGHE